MESDTVTPEAAGFPGRHLIRVLLDQHARIRELLEAVPAVHGELRQELFDQLRLLLAIHESAEEVFLRPLSRGISGAHVADARLKEEEEAAHVLAELELMDVSGHDFATAFQSFARAVTAHAETEEAEEFRKVAERAEGGDIIQSGSLILLAENWAPVHPQPRAVGALSLKTFGAFADMLDKSQQNFRQLI